MAKTTPGQSAGTISHRVTAPHALKVSKRSKRAVPHVAIPQQPEASRRGRSNSSKDINTPQFHLKTKRTSDLNRAQAYGSNENHPSNLKPLIKHKASGRKAARPSKRQKHIESDIGPIFMAYSQCTCDLKTMSKDGEELSHAIAKGKVVHIIDSDRSSTPHLLSCEANRPLTRTSYDPKTIATDILVAEGIHPYLPALNAHLMDVCWEEWR